MPCRAMVSGAAPCHSGGYSMAPTPMIAPWPAMSRGTECWVPNVPGLVRLMVVPAKSATERSPDLARRTTSS